MTCSGATPVSGQPLGTFILQVSNEQVAPGAFPTRWADLVSLNISGNDSVLIPETALSYQWIQFAYTYNQGTGGTVIADIWLWGPQ